MSDGYELCRFVRSSQHLSHLPIILLSGLDPKNAETEQVNAFLAKPITPEEVFVRILFTAVHSQGHKSV